MDGTEAKLLTNGTVLKGRYRIEEEVARGRKGAIYRTTDLTNNSIVAMKEMAKLADQAQHDKAVQQFKAEFETLSNLDHTNLPKVWTYFEEDGKHYLVMDFVEAKTLEAVLNELGKPVPEPQALAWLKQLLDVLEYLHSREPPVIFRDLRPANIMVTTKGQIKLVDFGIAKMIQGTGSQGRTLFRAVGSPEFAPPEQFGMSRSDPRTDIYSLGATLYNLLTKTLPPQATDRVIRGAPLKKVSEINPTVSEQLEKAIYKMMDIKPAERYSTVSDIKAALAPLLAGVGGEAPKAAAPAAPEPTAAKPAPPAAATPVEAPRQPPPPSNPPPSRAPEPKAAPRSESKTAVATQGDEDSGEGGGVVGKVIVGLVVLGAGVAAYGYFFLQWFQ